MLEKSKKTLEIFAGERDQRGFLKELIPWVGTSLLLKNLRESTGTEPQLLSAASLGFHQGPRTVATASASTPVTDNMILQ